ncbi:glycosyltransferase family 2 protein [Actibacterium pelagium]|uniref:Glycosyl transferase n=1 Tax=Actibacterium pelagium TaxID=2029103 RepID=A0A917AGY0_9RHOB|nr:glycosyltransferase family 2 protein [Actibacterium pelagium]GGE51087.1 glycosyl transferase [Actibacterium pelagium]
MLSPKIGVVIVTYNAAQTVGPCVNSLLPCPDSRMRIVIVDNCSTDETRDVVMGLSEQNPQIDLIRASGNIGFAGGVNLGLQQLLRDREITHFWLLNPDCIVSGGTVSRLIQFLEAGKGAGLTGGRVAYVEPSDRIQTDGGTVNWKTGVTHNLHQNLSALRCPSPDPEQIDFASGASLLVSRRFVQDVGLMDEGFFLYYEESDWAMRRGTFPIEYCDGFTVEHHAGAAIGSAVPGRMPSPLSAYFLHRSRMRFLRIWGSGPSWRAKAFGIGKALQLALRGGFAPASEVLRGTFGLGPSKRTAALLPPEVQAALKSDDYRTSTPSSSRKLPPSPSQTTR